jgi:GNAT superfamily N-acetyltransferase
MIITETKSHDDIQFIHDNLYEFNLSKTGAQRQEIIVPDTPERTAFAVRDEENNICGGIVFYYQDNGETLYVELLWMAEILRGQDFGTTLISKVKERAIESKCRKIKLTTQSFQAPGFYKKMGFNLYGTRPDGDHTTYLYELVLN